MTIVAKDKISFEPVDGWIKAKTIDGYAWYHPGLRKAMESPLTTLPFPDDMPPKTAAVPPMPPGPPTPQKGGNPYHCPAGTGETSGRFTDAEGGTCNPQVTQLTDSAIAQRIQNIEAELAGDITAKRRKRLDEEIRLANAEIERRADADMPEGLGPSGNPEAALELNATAMLGDEVGVVGTDDFEKSANALFDFEGRSPEELQELADTYTQMAEDMGLRRSARKLFGEWAAQIQEHIDGPTETGSGGEGKPWLDEAPWIEGFEYPTVELEHLGLTVADPMALEEIFMKGVPKEYLDASMKRWTREEMAAAIDEMTAAGVPLRDDFADRLFASMPDEEGYVLHTDIFKGTLEQEANFVDRETFESEWGSDLSEFGLTTADHEDYEKWSGKAAGATARLAALVELDKDVGLAIAGNDFDLHEVNSNFNRLEKFRKWADDIAGPDSPGRSSASSYAEYGLEDLSTLGDDLRLRMHRAFFPGPDPSQTKYRDLGAIVADIDVTAVDAPTSIDPTLPDDHTSVTDDFAQRWMSGGGEVVYNTQDALRGATKARIVDDLVQTIEANSPGFFDDVSYDPTLMVSKIVHDWALSAQSPGSADMHLLVDNAMTGGTSYTTPGGGASWELEDRESFHGQTAALREEFVKAVYANTQAQLEAAGIEQVRVSRGTMWASPRYADSSGSLDGSWKGIPALEEIVQQSAETRKARPVTDVEWDRNPLSSWTTDHRMAENFSDVFTHMRVANGEGEVQVAAVQTVNVPASAVWSTARTGPGAFHESEWILLDVGGKSRVQWYISQRAEYEEEYDDVDD